MPSRSILSTQIWDCRPRITIIPKKTYRQGAGNRLFKWYRATSARIRQRLAVAASMKVSFIRQDAFKKGIKSRIVNGHNTKVKALIRLMMPKMLLIVPLLLMSCSTGRMVIKEQHYYAVRRGDDANYYRLKLRAKTFLGDAEYRSGWFPSHAVDSLFGDVTSGGGAKALETRRAIEKQIREKIVETDRAWLNKAADPEASDKELEKLLEARRRVLAYPIWEASPVKGTFEIEYNPARGVAMAHADEKLVFVLSSDPDEVIGKIANFAETDKTVLSINQFAKITAQRVRNQIAADEAAEEVNKRIDNLIHAQMQKALEVLDPFSFDKTEQAISEIDTLLRLLESIR